MAKSEMRFYKVDDQNFVFSVQSGYNGAIRYYQALIGEDGTCNVRRIRNALAFLKESGLPRVKDFSSDYAKIITSLIDYCDTDSMTIDYEARRKKAIDYSRLLKESNKNVHYASANHPERGTLIISSKPSKVKVMEEEGEAFYEVDNEDKMFITSGIRNNTTVNAFKLQ